MKPEDRPVTIYRFDNTSKNGNPYTTYSMGASSKDKDGNWVNGYVPVQFRFGTDIPNKAKIRINDFSFNATEYNGKVTVKPMIWEYEIVEEGEKPKTDNDGFMDIPDNIDAELPFR